MCWTAARSARSRSRSGSVLKFVLRDYDVLIPEVVEQELRQGADQHRHLHDVQNADWIKVVTLTSPEQLDAFSFYVRRLLRPDGRNLGECGVLALAETTPNSVAVVDDRRANKAARGRPVTVRRTLGLLCEAIQQEQLTVAMVSAVADDLLAAEYRLPFEPGGFAQWAADEGGLG